jgi:two-component system OmpR family response regulator
MMRILCVDDDRTSLLLTRRILERAFPDDELFAAASGEEAVKLLGSRAIDLVITDLVMPGLSGIDVLEEAKREHGETEVIMVTAHSSVESAVQAMQKGARDYLAKPIHGELLVEKVGHLRELLQSRRDLEDYRYAMAVLEKDATRAAVGSERRLEGLQEQMQAALAIIERRDLPAEQRLERIRLLMVGGEAGAPAAVDSGGMAAVLTAQEK